VPHTPNISRDFLFVFYWHVPNLLMTQTEFFDKWRPKFLELMYSRAQFFPPADPTWDLMHCTFEADAEPDDPNPGGFSSKRLYKFGGYDNSFTSQNPIHQWFRFSDFLRIQHYYPTQANYIDLTNSFLNQCYQFSTGKGLTIYGVSANFQTGSIDGAGRNYESLGIPLSFWNEMLQDQRVTAPVFSHQLFPSCSTRWTDASSLIPLFYPLGPRKPRIYGQKDSAWWRQFHSEWRNGRKFTRQTSKLVAHPNAKGFGNDGTKDWKDSIRDAAKRVAVNVAQDAVKSAAKNLKDKAARAAGARIKKQATNALKEILRKR